MKQQVLHHVHALYTPKSTVPATTQADTTPPTTQPTASSADLNRIACDCQALRAAPSVQLPSTTTQPATTAPPAATTPTAATTQPADSTPQTPYSLTIYVEEGSLDKACHGCMNGHVFLRLANGADKQTIGFYSQDKSLALAGQGGGQVRDDSKSEWTVRKSYPLTAEQYQKAQKAVADWKANGQAWSPNHHCGDFAETVAKAAGIDLQLPQTYTGRNRPNLFADYLRTHGGSDDHNARLPGD